MNNRQLILSEIEAERQAQDREHGGPAHDDTHTCNDWLAILVRHLGLAGSDEAVIDPVRFRRQMIRVGALAVAIVESFDRKAGQPKVAGDYTPGSGF